MRKVQVPKAKIQTISKLLNTKLEKFRFLFGILVIMNYLELGICDLEFQSEGG